MAKQVRGLGNKVKALTYAEDRTGELLWNILAPTLVYAAKLHGEIADDIVAIDNAMKWGFGWAQGPFEIWDAVGVKQSLEKMKGEGREIPAFVEEMLAKGIQTFYSEIEGVY